MATSSGRKLAAACTNRAWAGYGHATRKEGKGAAPVQVSITEQQAGCAWNDATSLHARGQVLHVPSAGSQPTFADLSRSIQRAFTKEASRFSMTYAYVSHPAGHRGIDEAEREVFELEDTDINPIGCISGKNCIVRARNYDDVSDVESN
jgi:hypothetical protein